MCYASYVRAFVCIMELEHVYINHIVCVDDCRRSNIYHTLQSCTDQYILMKRIELQ